MISKRQCIWSVWMYVKHTWPMRTYVLLPIVAYLNTRLLRTSKYWVKRQIKHAHQPSVWQHQKCTINTRECLICMIQNIQFTWEALASGPAWEIIPIGTVSERINPSKPRRPISLAWFNFNPSKDRLSLAQWNPGWNYLSFPKLQRCVAEVWEWIS